MKKIITLITFLSVFFSYSQTKEQDSLAIQLAFQNSDTLKVKTTLQLVKSLYESNNYDKALKYISLSDKIATGLNYSEGVAETVYYKALIYAKKDDYINAIDNYSKSKELYIELKDTLGIAKVNNSIGLIEIKRGNYKKGLEYSLMAIKELEKRNLKQDLCLAYRNLGQAYYNINDYDKAIEFNLKTLEIENQLGNAAGALSSNKSLAELYSIKKEHRRAIEYYEKVLSNIGPNNDSIKSDVLPKIGGEYLRFNEYSKALDYLIEGLQINRRTNNKPGLLISLNNLGDLNLQQRRLKSAEIQLREARDIAREIDNKQELLKNYSLMKALDSTRRNFANAFVWQREYYNLKNNLNTAKIQDLKNTVTDISISEDIRDYSANNTELIAIHEQETLKNLKQIDRYKLILYSLIAAFAVVLTILMLIYLQRSNSIKYTRELEVKNKKIEMHNEAILEQTKHLEDINKVKDRLFSIVSHDLKDSLTSIKGFIDLLKDGELSTEEFNNLIPELSENANNASLLLFNLLNWSKSQMQSLESNPTLFDIQDVFTDKVHLLEQNVERKNLTIKDQTLRDFIYADRSMVEIIIQNLLTNAIKFSKTGDTITISNHISNGNSIISIADSGVGISKENIDKLFNKNSSFTTIGTKNEKGTGLGLTICKELVELNNGKIWVESALNVGSTFYVQLPKSSPKE